MSHLRNLRYYPAAVGFASAAIVLLTALMLAKCAG